jgi:hypothetical protein
VAPASSINDKTENEILGEKDNDRLVPVMLESKAN